LLYEFYHVQNSKKPGSIHATYLLDGVPSVQKDPNVNVLPQDSEDLHMQSSPYMSSSMPHEANEEEKIPSRSIALAREEDLEGNKLI